MTEYETLVILHPDVGDAPGTVRKIKDVLETQGGRIRGVDEWGARELAYEIRRQRKGYYAILQHTATPEAVAELERQLKLNDDVLRFLTVRQESAPAPLRKASTDEGTDSGDAGAEVSEEE